MFKREGGGSERRETWYLLTSGSGGCFCELLDQFGGFVRNLLDLVVLQSFCIGIDSQFLLFEGPTTTILGVLGVFGGFGFEQESDPGLYKDEEFL